jgi:hypothetical protein
MAPTIEGQGQLVQCCRQQFAGWVGCTPPGIGLTPNPEVCSIVLSRIRKREFAALRQLSPAADMPAVLAQAALCHSTKIACTAERNFYHECKKTFATKSARTGLMQCSKLFYSMTSSARPSSESGKVIPSILAALTLITSSTFVACITGRSAGFAPLRMRLA